MLNVYDRQGLEVSTVFNSDALNTRTYLKELASSGGSYFVKLNADIDISYPLLFRKRIVSGSGISDMPELAKTSGCSACHAIGRKVVGPAWRDVAKRYRGDLLAMTKLVNKVKTGGRGNWKK